MRDIVAFKGKQSSLEIEICRRSGFFRRDEGDNRTAGSKTELFRGVRLLNVVGGSLDEDQKDELSNMLKRDYGMLCVEFEGGMKRTRQKLFRSRQPEQNEEKPAEFKTRLVSQKEGSAVFIRETVRNGQRIDYDGDIVVCGDVNFGGRAGGNRKHRRYGALGASPRRGRRGRERRGDGLPAFAAAAPHRRDHRHSPEKRNAGRLSGNRAG
jgi:septum site-determining protein MinC